MLIAKCEEKWESGASEAESQPGAHNVQHPNKHVGYTQTSIRRCPPGYLRTGLGLCKVAGTAFSIFEPL